MVRHQEGEREYWTLPGGGVEAGETCPQAVVREVVEETGLHVESAQFLFEETSGSTSSKCLCFLAHVPESEVPALGYDPEEAHLPAATRMLQGVEWHTLESMQHDIQVKQVIACLGRSNDMHPDKRSTLPEPPACEE